jgi:hypothetical protein
MANYIATARSNVFRVKDAEAFLAWTETLPGVTAEAEHSAPDRFVLLMPEQEYGGWPTMRESDGEPGVEEFDFVFELAEHLAEDSVAVLEEVGHEKLRYLVGYAVAVNHLGEEIYVSLDEVYERAEAAGWGTDIPRAAY